MSQMRLPSGARDPARVRPPKLPPSAPMRRNAGAGRLLRTSRRGQLRQDLAPGTFLHRFPRERPSHRGDAGWRPSNALIDLLQVDVLVTIR